MKKKKSNKEFNDRMENLSRRFGNLTNRFGEIVEELVLPNLCIKFRKDGFNFGNTASSGFYVICQTG